VPAVPAADPPEVVDLFEDSIDALIRGDFATAEKGFAEVAERSVEEERRAAAAELARQARKRFQPAEEEKKRAGSARVSYLTSTLIVGLNYGWMVPVILDIDDTRAFVGVSLLTASAAFAAPYLLTRGEHISRGMATLGGAGSYLGVGHGALLYGLFAGKDRFGGDKQTRAMLATMLASSIAEGSAGYMWAKRNQISGGHALTMTTGSLWGVAYAAGLNAAIGGEDANFRLLMGSMLTGTAAGVVGGHYYAENRKPATGDTWLLNYAGLLGVYTAFSPIIISELDSLRGGSAIILGGATAGLLAGDFLVKDNDYSGGRAGIIILGSLAGGLLGAGGAFLIAPDDADTEKWIWPGSAAGAIGGLAVMLKVIEPKATPDDSGTAMYISPTFGPNGHTGLGLAGSF
jgi:hypothetical protein